MRKIYFFVLGIFYVVTLNAQELPGRRVLVDTGWRFSLTDTY